MARRLKDPGGQPAATISLTITPPRLERLQGIATALRMSRSQTVELLIDSISDDAVARKAASLEAQRRKAALA